MNIYFKKIPPYLEFDFRHDLPEGLPLDARELEFQSGRLAGTIGGRERPSAPR